MVELRREDPGTFKKFLRMSTEMYDDILGRVRHRLVKQHTRYREPFDPGLKLAASLRHLVSGVKYSEMQYSWRVADNTLSVVVRDVMHAICEEYVDEVMTAPSAPEGWRQLADGFLKNWNFPNCVAAIDGKPIAIRNPASSGFSYYNYKGFFSIILLASVDSDYKFVWCDLGGYGSSKDAKIYNESEFLEMVQDGSIGFPDPQLFPNDTVEMPFFLVGDDAFSLSENMQKPYGHRVLTRDERILNYRLSRARRVSENAFGILANRFQMNHSPSTVRPKVKTCCILHNLMRIKYPTMQNALVDHDNKRGDLFTGKWRNGRNLEDIRNLNINGPQHSNQKGNMVRNTLMHWVSSPAGCVPWQDRMVPH
ncbi:putative nuclease HARBI1 [Dreissena polymorpha]|uniref:putative nuclease HARBI1 n=1 Tax=Dreissena polymorpha TaxID=45954 RepID=UPI0022640A10|nr:putative nuclease HARBI1 [Dreissena polymorpha]